MYTILVTQDNELITSIKERIMQRSKLVDNLHFLVDPIYKEIDMTDFVVTLEYILPVSKEYETDILVKSDELYKGTKLEYKLPFDTKLTKEPGEIEVQLTFAKIELDENGQSIQLVRKTSSCFITIVPISAWSDIIPDSALNAIDQRILETQAQIKALEELSGVIATAKADNIVLDESTHELYLTANGEAIGNRIDMDELGDAIVENAEDGLVTMII